MDRQQVLEGVDRRQGRTPLVLIALGALVLVQPFARGLLPASMAESLPGPWLTEILLGVLFFYMAALVFERQRLNAAFRDLLGSFDEFLRDRYGDDFRERMQAVQVLIRALNSTDAEVRTKSHEQLVRITGQQFPAEAPPWEAWWAQNRMSFLARRKGS